VSLQQRFNAVLRRTTGYVLTRPEPDDRGGRPAKRTRQRADAQDRPSQQPAGGTGLPRYFDAEKRRIIEQVRDRTMTTPPKLGALIDGMRYIAAHRIEGDIVECGVWRGGSMQAMALTLMSVGDVSRSLHLFDTFEGMPPPAEEDARTRAGVVTSAAELLEASDRTSKVWAAASLEDVQQGMAATGYPAELVHYHPGLVEETTPHEAPERIAILRLDTDWYSSTRHELRELYPRLSPGGLLLIDDYHAWDGAKKAVDEWLAETGEPLFMAPMGAGLIAVKPPHPSAPA